MQQENRFLLQKFIMSLNIQINNIVELYQKGQLEEAKNVVSKLIKTNSNIALLHNLLGAINNNLNDFKLAKLSFKKAIKIDANYADAFSNLGAVLIELNEAEGANKNLLKAIQLNPKQIEAYISLGKLCRKFMYYEQEVEHYHKALEIDPNSIIVNSNLASVYTIQGNVIEAKKILEKVINLNPNAYKAYNRLGSISISNGDKDNATKYFKKAIEINPKYADGFRTLSNNIKLKKDAQLITKMENIYNDKTTDNENKMLISFALGKAFSDIKNYKLAFRYYEIGNQIRKNLLGYDLKQDKNKFQFIKTSFDNDFKSSDKKKNSDFLKIPVFILGMPRSGTTLTEQIISSHSRVYGGGELSFVSQSLVELDWERNITNQKFIEDFRLSYLKKLSKIKTSKALITDKMPGNFLWAGLILNSMPDIKIVHTKRNAQATMWSIFKTYFTADGNGWAYNINDIYKYYRMYEELMEFWYKKYPKKIYILDYEKLTTNQEKISRELINFVGLDWEDQCLEFHQTKRSVRTASSSQVRQKMYQGSSDEWMKYQNFLPDYFKS